MKTRTSFTLRGYKALMMIMVVLLLGKASYAQTPANDLCNNAVVLTSSTACSSVAGTLKGALISVPAVATTCGTAGADVWYSFVAQTAYPNITLSATGTSLGTANARIQVFSGACGALTSLGCAPGNFLSTASIFPAGLTPGTTYYIRIYSNTIAPSGGSVWDFSICVTDPPANDLCINAVTLTSASVCTATPGTLNNAAISVPAVTTACGIAGGDVWYSFVAQSVNPTITLSSLGANLTGTNARIQLFSGTCGSFTSLGCVSASTFYTAVSYPTGLTPGTTYYIRVYSNTLAPTGGSAWDFAICVTDPPVNDLCANAITLTSGTVCTNITGTTNYASFTTGTTAGCAIGVKFDVWYSFTAQSANPTITLNNIEANLALQNPRIQVFSGSCGALVSIGCSSTTAYTAALGLTVGNTYLVRIYSTTGTAAPATLGNFDICIQDPIPPVNDECAGAILLTSSTTCNNITNTVVNATPSTGVPAVCAGTAKYDVWYTFVAQTTNPAIKLTTVGTTFNGQTPRIQILSGTCGSLVSIACGTASFTPTGLTVGATYYLRVYSTTTSGVPGSLGNFDICIQDPLPPVNDNCSGAVLLTSAATCSNVAGSLNNSTPTAGIPNDCGNAASPEVWYSFVANSIYPTITLGSIGAQLTAAGPRIQLLSGTCGSFTSLACVAGTSMNAYLSTGGTGLTIGTTYYIRVYTNLGGMSGAAWGFTICITDPPPPLVDYGKSYVNITKGSGGGTIEPGDELEIRATVAVRSNYAFGASFTGSIPVNTTYVPNTLRILTNEGQVYKQWTDAADGDPATVTGSTVNFNLGAGATQTLAGVIKNTDRPVGGGGSIIIVAYHVIVNAVSFGSLVSVGGGNLSYTNSAGTVTNITFPAVTAIVYKNYGICTNTVGSNGILSENGGTFGSGSTKDRAISANIPTNYTYTAFTANAPGDYFYGISNNTSGSTAVANYSIDPNDPVSAHRVFGVWDIIGDHTGASNQLAGNPATDVNSGQSGGYMVVINASYRTDTAFLDTVRNLCPNTSYEYSAWFRNMCRKCSIDSTGASPASVGYVPTGPGDTSGVHPNLTFNINGYDYYTTGDMGYTGQWVKKGFTYRTGPSETQMIINIRNNAPGGGGNDWAIDDIGVATCSPTLNLNPSTPNVNVCYGDGKSLSADVTSFFDNYTYYSWELSTDRGATYLPTAYYSSGTITPTFTGTDYTYTATGPSFIGDSTTNFNIYRLRVASSAGNLADTNCSFLAVRTVQVLVNNCMYVLKADLINVAATLRNNNTAAVQWQTVNESDQTIYEIEKSTDGIHFMLIGKVKGNAVNGKGTYMFNDPAALTSPGYYRIKMVEKTGFKYSKVLFLSPSGLSFMVKNLLNPVSTMISCNVIIPDDGLVRATIFDMYGRAVKTYKQPSAKGVNPLKIQDIGDLSNGTYFLKVEWQNESIIQKIIKSN